MRAHSRQAALLALLALLGLGCAPEPPPSIVLVVADTLRRDALGCYGDERAISPFIDSLAEESLVFDRARTVSSWTAPAVASLFTSLYPHQHGVVTGHSRSFRNRVRDDVATVNRIPDGLDTLAERLQAAGYTTFGVTTNGNIVEELGFTAGFDHFEYREPEDASQVAAVVEDWAARIDASRPWFLFLHFMDAHRPYHAREPWFDHELRPVASGATFADGTPLGTIPPYGLSGTDLWRIATELAKEGDVEGSVEYALELGRAAYRSEVAYLDEHLGRIFDRLSIDRDVAVVFLSDHGEEFGEHGSVGHGLKLYEELISIPLIVRLPGAERVGRRADPVSLLDVYPTVLELAGVEPHPGLAGRSLLAEPRARDAPVLAMRTDETTSDSRELVTLVRGDEKLVRGPADGAVEWYDLDADPGERQNDAERRPDRVEALSAELRDLYDSLPVEEREFGQILLAPDYDAELERLGYADEP